MSIRRTFMLIDENSDKRIQYSEFEKMLKRYRFNLSQVEINNLFNYFDKDGSGYIDYGEFIGGILGDLSKFRKDILKQVFDKIDKNETGTITVDQLREAYNPKEHPLVRQGKRSEDEILGDFIDSLEYHFSLLNEKNDEENVDVNDIKIDFDDFWYFYKTISDPLKMINILKLWLWVNEVLKKMVEHFIKELGINKMLKGIKIIIYCLKNELN